MTAKADVYYRILVAGSYGKTFDGWYTKTGEQNNRSVYTHNEDSDVTLSFTSKGESGCWKFDTKKKSVRSNGVVYCAYFPYALSVDQNPPRVGDSHNLIV